MGTSMKDVLYTTRYISSKQIAQSKIPLLTFHLSEIADILLREWELNGKPDGMFCISVNFSPNMIEGEKL